MTPEIVASRRILTAALLSAFVAAGALTLADPASPIAVTNVDSPDPVSSGAELTYTITAINTGGSKITEVVLADQLNGVGGIGVPPQLQITSTRGTCSQNANLVTCAAGTIEGGGSWVVTIRGVVNAASGTTLNNTASISGTRSAQNFTTTATTTTLVNGGGGSGLPDLTIAKTGPTSVVAGSPMTYTLTVNNQGEANATGVRVVDTVPSGITGITAAGTSLFTCGVAAQTVACTGGAVNAGSNATITINATAPIAAGTITNTASVDPDNAIAEVNELNNTSALVDTSVTTGSAGTMLTINKTDDPAVIAGAGPDPVVPGAQITYQILVTNPGTQRADDVMIVDGTQGLEAASIAVGQVITDGTEGNFGGCTVTAPQTKCLTRTLDPGGTILMTVTGKVIASAGSTIINTATVTGNIRNTGLSATDSEITTVKPAVDLTITKSDSPDPVCARSWPGNVPAPPVCRGGLTYSFVVGNSGIQQASGVVVRDPLAPGLVLDSFAAPAFGGGCAVDGENVVSCSGGVIGPESTTTVTFTLVAPATVGTISNTVFVDPSNAIFEADETNNTASQATAVKTGIDLTIKKDDAIDPIATSGTQTYTITVDNIGTQDAAGIRVRDVLPANTRFRFVQGDNGFTCSHANGVVECVGGAILGTASEFYPPFGAPGDDTAVITIRVFAQPNVGTGPDGMHNEVRVDPLNEIAEADETNNFAFQDTSVATGGAGMGAFNQLTIDKQQVSPADPVARNAVVTFTIAVGNDGTDPVTGVTVRDFLPAGARYIEATGTGHFLCNELSSYIDCTGGEIAAGGTETITLKMFAPDTPGDYTNQAIVDPDSLIPEGNEFDNQDNELIDVENGGNGPFNDLQITKTAPPTVKPKGLISYTLQVLNTGSDPASQVTVRDELPMGTTFVSADDTAPGTPGAFTCGESGNVVTCSGATLQPGVPRILTIVARAPNEIVTLTNQAVVDPDNTVPEGDELNNTDTAVTAVQSAINFTLTKSGKTSSEQSKPTTYTLTIKNVAAASGGENAFGVEVLDPLPVGLIPLSVDTGTDNNFGCQVLENPINLLKCIGDLAIDQTVEIKVEVFMTAESGKPLDNVACIDPGNAFPEFDPDPTVPGSGEIDNCSTQSTFVGPTPLRSPDLLVTKSADPAVTAPGANLTYTVLVQNIGTAKAFGPLTVTDNLPADATFQNAVATNGWTCDHAAGVVTCHEPPAPGGGDGLDVGASTEITIQVTVKTTTTLPLTNAVSAAPAIHDPAETDAEDETAQHLANNTAVVTTSVGGSGFDLAITSITDNPDPVNRGQQVKYTVVAVNGGTSPANGVDLDVSIPMMGVTLMGADGTNGFNCGPAVASVVHCEGDLPPGGDTVVTLTFTVNLGAPNDLTLTAAIDPGGDFAETDETNNAQTEVTTVSGDTCTASPCIDLVAAQIVDVPNTLNSVPGVVTYNAVAVNVGDSGTTLDPTDPNQPLFRFQAFGPVTLSGAVTLSDPSVTCTDDPAFPTIPGVRFSRLCYGNLAPGAGVSITVPVNVTADIDVTAVLHVDPADLINEFVDHQPRPPLAPLSFGNNLLTKTTTVVP